ncbi:MAG: hypothetical protein U9Q22_06115 [Candidatus Altiarchaeota archaeon]|nr:hypothetical protein [Candidatus Altiarchaeota archaeon]
MNSLFKSNKGVETAPFFLVFSAVILVLTAAIVFPAMTNWQVIMNEGRAVKETMKLRNAVNEIHAMCDIGSVELVTLSLPPGYTINVNHDSLTLKDEDYGDVAKFVLDARVRGVKTIEGNAGITIAFWDEKSPVSAKGKNILEVY